MTPKRITVHASATRPSQNLVADDIRKMHLRRGWSDIGYHYVIRQDGGIEEGRPEHIQGAQVYGHNEDNLGICMIGGVDEQGVPTDNYNYHQYHSLYALIVRKCEEYSIDYKDVCGHRDWYGDSNGDGVIDSRDWFKECPCFDVRSWLKGKCEVYENSLGKLL